MPKYQTKQREQLLDFFSKNTDKSFSAVQIVEELENISPSAVYRNLAALEGEGKLKRAAKSGTREVYYRYMAAPSCKDSIHVSCTVCGETHHLDKNEAERLIAGIAALDGFKISKADTVLYGTCMACQKQEVRE